MSELMKRVSTPNPGPDLKVVGTYDSPEQVPNARIAITPGVLTYEDVSSLIAPDGRPIAATGQGSWGQLYAAGTP